MVNNHVCLLNGKEIPNDGSYHGLQHGFDTWLAANAAPIETPTLATIQELPPHSSLCFQEVSCALVPVAPPPPRIVEITDTGELSSDEEDFNILQVFAAKKRKTAKPTKPALSIPSRTPNPAIVTLSTRSTPEVVIVPSPPSQTQHFMPQFSIQISILG